MPRDYCSKPGCDRPRHGLNPICQYHYNRDRLAAMPKCALDGCSRRVFASDLCQLHYSRNLRHGDPTIVLPPKTNKGREHWKWTDTPTYSGIHQRVRKTLGPASTYICIRCPSPAQQWAYLHNDPAQLIDKLQGIPYSTDIRHYSPMCVSCHKTFDLDRLEKAS